MPDHPGGHALGEKIRTAQIGRDHLVETLFTSIEQIGADARRNARIVDQNIEPAQLVADIGNELLPVLRRRNIRLHVDGALAVFPELVQYRLYFLRANAAGDGQREARFREFERDAEAYAARAAGDQRYFVLAGMPSRFRKKCNSGHSPFS